MITLRRSACTARNSLDTVGPKLFAKRPRSRRRTETLEHGECLAFLSLASIQRQDCCMFVWASQLLPCIGGGPPLTGNLRGVRFRELCSPFVEGIHPEQPHGELAIHSRVELLSSQFVQGQDRPDNTFAIVRQPCSFSAQQQVPRGVATGAADLPASALLPEASWDQGRPVEYESERARSVPELMASSRTPIVWRAMSFKGARGRGVKSASQAPHKTRLACCRRESSLTRAVLPIPASPCTSAMHPPPAVVSR